jgi:hypothetical protein
MAVEIDTIASAAAPMIKRRVPAAFDEGACAGSARPVDRARVEECPVGAVEHWDGMAWSRVRSPNGSQLSKLVSVAAVDANDIWAVGATGYDLGSPLAEHWDGSKWTISKVPERGLVVVLNATAAASDGAVFAAGSYGHRNNLDVVRAYAIRR